jgi:glycosyl hydrolase family 44
VYGPQEKVAPENPDMGNGKTQQGLSIPPEMPPTRTSVPAPPEFIGKWLSTIREKDKKRGRSVKIVMLDNEPALWHSTHRDIHPNPVTYNELLEKTIVYGTVVRKAYPEVLIAGPTEWGWTNYFYSGLDSQVGVTKAPDRRAHGNVPIIPWWLHSVRTYEKKNKIKLIDILDVHYYPQGADIGVDEGGATDAATNALRIRSTRSLWDRSYVDESWISDRVELIPRLRRWVNENAPGLGIALGEYSFGAAKHQSGGLAQAEALGRFGTEGLTAAFYWYLPPKDSPAYWAYRAYRNFDGKGGRFLDLSVPVTPEAKLASLFVSRSEKSDHLVAVLLNLDPDEALAVDINLEGCAATYKERAFTYTGGPAGFVPAAASVPAPGAVLRRSAAPYSMTVLDLTAAQP